MDHKSEDYQLILVQAFYCNDMIFFFLHNIQFLHFLPFLGFMVYFEQALCYVLKTCCLAGIIYGAKSVLSL